MYEFLLLWLDGGLVFCFWVFWWLGRNCILWMRCFVWVLCMKDEVWEEYLISIPVSLADTLHMYAQGLLRKLVAPTSGNSCLTTAFWIYILQVRWPISCIWRFISRRISTYSTSTNITAKIPNSVINNAHHRNSSAPPSTTHKSLRFLPPHQTIPRKTSNARLHQPHILLPPTTRRPNPYLHNRRMGLTRPTHEPLHPITRQPNPPRNPKERPYRWISHPHRHTPRRFAYPENRRSHRRYRSPLHQPQREGKLHWDVRR